MPWKREKVCEAVAELWERGVRLKAEPGWGCAHLRFYFNFLTRERGVGSLKHYYKLMIFKILQANSPGLAQQTKLKK